MTSKTRTHERTNGVKFDDYKKGKLYEYKGDHRFLFDRNDDLRKWVKNPRAMRDQAVRQADAAAPSGLSVIWRVGKDQVEAFMKAVGQVLGITIVP